MTKDPDSISLEANALEALRLMEDSTYRHLPAVADGRLVGFVSRQDFFGSEMARLEIETGLWERL